MALGALTLSVTAGVQGLPFQATINGLTTGRVEVLGDGSPGFSTVNGKVMSSGLPYPISTVVLREYDPGQGQGYRDSRIDITAATATSLRAQAIASLGAGRTLVRYRVAGDRQSDGSIVYSLKVEDDLGSTISLTPGGGTPTPTPSPIFTTQPSISPTSGTAGATTFTTNDGAASNATSYTRRWLLNGTAIATGATVTPSSAGTLTLEVTATGAGGSTVATSAGVTIAAASATLARSQNTRTYGSSTYANRFNDSTTNLRGTASPVDYRGATWQARTATLIPSPSGKTITNAPLSPWVTPGNNGTATDYNPYETLIRAAIQGEWGNGTINVSTKVIFGGINSNVEAGMTEWDLWQTDQGIMSDLTSYGIQKWALGSIQFKPDYTDNDALTLHHRKQTYFLANPHPYHGYFGFHEGHMRAAEDPFTASYFVAADYTQIANRARPDSLVHTDSSHDVGFGYHILGNYYAKVEAALEGGVPFLPTIDYFARRTTPGAIGDVLYMGDLTGCTASINDPNYSVTIVDNPAYPTDPRPKLLKLAASVLPTKAGLPLRITLNKAGFGSETYNITVSVSQRTGTAPAKVRLRNQVIVVARSPEATSGGYPPPYFPADTRKMTLVWIARMEEDDGLSTNGIAAGGSDSREHRIFYYRQNAKQIIALRRTTSGAINLIVLDNASTPVNAINASVTPFRKDQGMRALFLSYDADQPGKCAIYGSAGKLTSTGAAYALATTAITPGGTGTLGLGRATSSSADGLALFGNAGSLPNFHLEATKQNLWLSTDSFIDFSVKANRDLFFDETTQTAVDLGSAAGIVQGITPQLYLPGDAAEMYVGCREISHNDRQRGGQGCRNFGSLPGLTCGLIGELETVSA